MKRTPRPREIAQERAALREYESAPEYDAADESWRQDEYYRREIDRDQFTCYCCFESALERGDYIPLPYSVGPDAKDPDRKMLVRSMLERCFMIYGPEITRWKKALRKWNGQIRTSVS